MIDHDPVTTGSHDHMHTNYQGGVHRHPHAHTGDHSHAPEAPNHLHQLAASNPVTAGIRARAAATGAPDLTADEIYRRLYGDG